MFIIAIAAGIISNVPGGVGVFESVLLLLFRTVPPDQLLGSLLAYRIIYYLVPFGADRWCASARSRAPGSAQ
jgi:uncharacterized membrane protein YbhN (UPF0104 family)